ncbi:hypothetical protein [Saccharomonospora iraqiensis]|uniref:hypothetical protein n=1 Tax=Saccharomonospora iraqiensis TaxID=52698 RepID=UPI001F458C5D|nr:hypothetical protein [Saccharomonospora iraqiensis]
MSEPPRTATGELDVSHHQFFLLDDPVKFPTDTVGRRNGLVGTAPGAVVVLTGIHTGVVNVIEQLHHTEPPVDVTEWDDVVEVSFEAPHGRMIATPLMTDPPPDLLTLSFHGPGPYRLRVHARGRDNAVDLAPEEVVETYLLSVWPAPVAAEVVHKQTDAYGAGIRA